MLGGILYLSLTMLPPFDKEICDNLFGYTVNH